ncbi:MAG: crosslink repair DNA glycosylase YcaQ family protein, partial [Acidobacteriota bacterium]
MHRSASRASLSVRQARRLALLRAGLLKPAWTGLPRSAIGRGQRARRAAWAVISRFGYLQLDTVAISGARSHTIVLLSRIGGLEPELGEALLVPGEPLFEYWGHEASWMPLDLYPTFEFRRRQYRHHPWWGDVLGENPTRADLLLRRIRDDGPLRSLDMEGSGGSGWNTKLSKRIASAFWSRGDLAIRERRNFQRVYDLAERVIPAELLQAPEPFDRALRTLLMRAIAGFGWAQTGTLTATWRLRNMKSEIDRELRNLVDDGRLIECDLVDREAKHYRGWIRP